MLRFFDERTLLLKLGTRPALLKVSLSLEDSAPQGFTMPMSAVFPTAAAPGPAGRWLINRLKQEQCSV
jgi:hypothetical protein